MKRKNKKGWFNEPFRHGLARHGIKTAQGRESIACGKDDGDETINYGDYEIGRRVIPNAHDPYEANIYARYDDEKGELVFEGSYHRVVDTWRENIGTHKDPKYLRVIRYYKLNGNEVRYEYEFDPKKTGGYPPSDVEEYIFEAKIYGPLSERLYVRELPKKLSGEGNKLFDELSERGNFYRDSDNLNISPDFESYSVDFAFEVDSEDAEELFEELEEIPGIETEKW